MMEVHSRTGMEDFVTVRHSFVSDSPKSLLAVAQWLKHNSLNPTNSTQDHVNIMGRIG
jgi:hypothetical protein